MKFNVIQKFLYNKLHRTKRKDKLFETYNKDRFLCIIYNSNTDTYLSKDGTWTKSDEDMLVLGFKEAYYRAQKLPSILGINLLVIDE